MMAASMKGFALPAAVFIVVIVGAAALAMGQLGSTQAGSLSLEIQASRAYWAARSGIDWGVYKINNEVVGAACFADQTLSNMADALSNFSVVVSCSRIEYKEANATAAPNLFSYTITAQASSGGSPANSDYVFKQLQATVITRSN